MLSPLEHRVLTAVLQDRQFYDIACAMRGPDTYDPAADRLKLMTTAVIRNLAGLPPATNLSNPYNLHGAACLTPDQAMIYWSMLTNEAKGRTANLLVACPHFKGHVKRALLSLPGGDAYLQRLKNWGFSL